jgi:hypothetical protein
MDASPSSLTPAQLHERTLPRFIYSYSTNINELHRTDLFTGERSSHQIPYFMFDGDCRLTEMPRIGLLVTGGGVPITKKVQKIDTLREFAVSRQAPMLTARGSHAAVYHARFVYVLGGNTPGGRPLIGCERYVCTDNRWQALSPLPRPCSNIGTVVVERCLYALGGYDGSKSLDLVMQLSLERLTWKLLELKLPKPGFYFPCFKVRSTEVYLLMHKTLYSFTPLKITKLKTVSKDIWSYVGTNYYCRGTLYCASQSREGCRLKIGELT